MDTPDGKASRLVLLEVESTRLEPGQRVPPPGAPSGRKLVVPKKPQMWFLKAPPREYVLFKVSVFDAEGRPVGVTPSFIPSVLLESGFHEFATQAGSFDPKSEPPAGLAAKLEGAVSALLAFRSLLLENPSMKVVLDLISSAVVETPSLASKLGSMLRGSFEAGLSINPQAVKETSSPVTLPAGEQAYAIPVTVTMNQQPAATFELTVVPPRGAYAISSGIVSIRGRHPTDAKRRFEVRILAARRGGR